MLKTTKRSPGLKRGREKEGFFGTGICVSWRHRCDAFRSSVVQVGAKTTFILELGLPFGTYHTTLKSARTGILSVYKIRTFEKPKIHVMLKEPAKEKKSKLVQIMNELDDLTDEEKSFVLYWLRAKKSALAAAEADLTILPNHITPEDIYKERNAGRKQIV